MRCRHCGADLPQDAIFCHICGQDLRQLSEDELSSIINAKETEIKHASELRRLADDIGGRYDVLIVLGSRNCGYRAERALEIAGKDIKTVFVVTGGNTHKNGRQTEAGFMAGFLRSHGIAEHRILIEDRAENTFRNLELSAEIIKEAAGTGLVPKSGTGLRIGIVTAGFHVPRTRRMAASIAWYADQDVVFIPAYGEHTRPDNWYDDPVGRSIGLSEIAKATV